MNILSSELCKSCIHTKVCMKDKNLCGDVFVLGHPVLFDNHKLYEEYKKREAAGFPCDDYIQDAEQEKGTWVGGELGHCSFCGHEGCASDIWNDGNICFCPYCGADLRGAK